MSSNDAPPSGTRRGSLDSLGMSYVERCAGILAAAKGSPGSHPQGSPPLTRPLLSLIYRELRHRGGLAVDILVKRPVIC